ncbi:transglycosylase family protein [Streptomyces sp. NPDC001941]|uniref:transglycosylase family protein n=1 Tax=Streptomyces sp. NPDC001941 TaxID=3154659 RepID=UPI00331EEF62
MGTHRKPRPSTNKSRAVSLGIGSFAAPALAWLAAPTASAAPVSTWDKVAQCESTGNWSVNTGNGYYGGLQFSASSWAAAGGTQYASSAHLATKEQQIATAERLLEMQGPGAWPTCGAQAGLARGGEAPEFGAPEQYTEPDTGSSAEPETWSDGGARQAEQQADPVRDGGLDGSYVVRQGDTLGKIAAWVGTSWEQLYEDNRATIGADPHVIVPGQELDFSSGEQHGGETQLTEPQPDEPDTAGTPDGAPVPPVSPDSPGLPEQDGGQYGDWHRPVEGGALTASYGQAGSWAKGYHTGTDFAVPEGTPLQAVTDATVVSAGWDGAYGNAVVLQLPDGHYALYAHLSSVAVATGQQVGAGQQIGLSGNTGNSTGPHLHFEIRTANSYGSDTDPHAYLGGKGLAI